MSADTLSLLADATRVLEKARRSFEAGCRTVSEIPIKREEAQRRVAEAQERKVQAQARYERAVEEERDRDYVYELQEEYSRISWAAFKARDLLWSDDLDMEHQKAVARQVAGFVREEFAQKLDAIARRSEDPQVRRTVAQYKEEISQSAHQLIREFQPARELLLSEVKQAQAAARRIIDE